MKKRIEQIVKILLSLAVIPLSFVKLFHDVGVLPSLDGKPVERHYYYSVMDNLQAYDIGFLVPILIAFAVLSVIVTAVHFWKEDKKWRLASRVLTVVTAVLFVLLLTVASTVARGY